MLYRCCGCYNIVLCLGMLFYNDATLFYELQYCVVFYYVIFQRDNVVFCLVISVNNDAMLFCNVIMFFRKLQYRFVSYYIILCLIILFCIITTLFCVLLCSYLML